MNKNTKVVALHPQRQADAAPAALASDIKGLRAEDDGVKYINIYSRGMTTLGRKLSHFAHTPFTHPYYGPFKSMEGFWFYMRSAVRDDKLRYLTGRDAKFYGRELPPNWYDHFQEDILAANYQKIIQNEYIAEMMVASDLPFKHFYVYGVGKVMITPRESEWLVQGFEEIRSALKAGKPSQAWINAEKRYVQSMTDSA